MEFWFYMIMFFIGDDKNVIVEEFVVFVYWVFEFVDVFV